MTGIRPTTQHVFKHWNAIAKRICASRKIILFLDFDGTLVEIAPKPDLVRLADDTRDVLEKLAGHPEVTLAVISGRRRVELQSYLGIHKMKYLGLYGWERNGNARLSAPVVAALRRARVNLTSALGAYPGVWIEPKQKSFSVHLLGTSEETQSRVRRKVRTRLRPFRGTLRAMNNIRDIEVAPASIEGKGAAVREFLSKTKPSETLPIYFGDDLSDEPGFTAVRKGISILVGKRGGTRAQFYLRGPKEVAATLSRIEATLARKCALNGSG